LIVYFEENTLFQGIFAIIGVALGFGLYRLNDHLIEKKSKKKYAKLFYFELNILKNEINERLETYHIMDKNKQTFNPNPKDNPYKFLLRLNYKPKYIFLEQNFGLIPILSSETIQNIMRIYSFLVDFEECRRFSIKSTNTQESEKIGMGETELLLVINLERVQKLIPETLLLLKNE